METFNIKEVEIDVAAGIVSKMFMEYYKELFEILHKTDDFQALADLEVIFERFQQNKTKEELDKVSEFNSSYIKKFAKSNLNTDVYLYAIYDLLVCFAVGFLKPLDEVKEEKINEKETNDNNS